mmetsp:Transcript_18749/g.54371  ORF Transcript_18749/g.54371 Transcript_18749/m.54371 type:complete len:171 (+) Transcript_18749:32-544(+)
MADAANADQGSHPNPNSEADRCAYALWSAMLLGRELFYVCVRQEPLAQVSRHTVPWFIFHIILSAFVCISLFQESHLARCRWVNGRMWPLVAALKLRATARCPMLATPRRLGILSIYLSPLLSMDRMSESLEDGVSWIWTSLTLLSLLRLAADILFWLARCCSGGRPKGD